MKDKFYLLVGIVVIGGSIYFFLNKPAPAQYQVENWKTEEVVLTGPALRINEKLIPVEIADTKEKRTLGLSGRESLKKGTGLLFIFDATGKLGFWMKDMKFPIDIVWISEDWTVVTVEKNVAPETYPNTFYPSEPAKYVLELNAGEASEFGIENGQKLYLEN